MNLTTYEDFLNQVKSSPKNILEQAHALLRTLKEVSSFKNVDACVLLSNLIANLASGNIIDYDVSALDVDDSERESFMNVISQINNSEEQMLNFTGLRNCISLTVDADAEVPTIDLQYRNDSDHIDVGCIVLNTNVVNFDWYNELSLNELRDTLESAYSGIGYMAELTGVLERAINGFAQSAVAGVVLGEDALSSAISHILDNTESNGIKQSVSAYLDQCACLDQITKRDIIDCSSQGLQGIVSYITGLINSFKDTAQKLDSDGETYVSEATSLPFQHFAPGVILELISGVWSAVSTVLMAASRIVGAIALAIGALGTVIGRVLQAVTTAWSSTRFKVVSGRNVHESFEFVLDQMTRSKSTSDPLIEYCVNNGISVLTVYDLEYPLVYFMHLQATDTDDYYDVSVETHLSSQYDLTPITRLGVASTDNPLLITLASGHYYPDDIIGSVTEFNDENGDPCKVFWINSATQSLGWPTPDSSSAWKSYFFNPVNWSGDDIAHAPLYNGTTNYIPFPCVLHFNDPESLDFNFKPSSKQLLAAARSEVSYNAWTSISSMFSDAEQISVQARLMSGLALLYYCLIMNNLSYVGTAINPSSSVVVWGFNNADIDPKILNVLCAMSQAVASINAINFNMPAPSSLEGILSHNGLYANQIDSVISNLSLGFDALAYKGSDVPSTILLGDCYWMPLSGNFNQLVVNSISVDSGVAHDVSQALKRMLTISISGGINAFNMYPFIYRSRPFPAWLPARTLSVTEVNYDTLVDCWPSGFSCRLPTLSFEGYIKGLIADGVIAVSLVLATAAATILAVKVAQKRARLGVNMEAAKYDYEQHGLTDEDWKTYKTARLKYNLFSVLTGGGTVGLNAYQDSNANGIISSVSTYLKTNVLGTSTQPDTISGISADVESSSTSITNKINGLDNRLQNAEAAIRALITGEES